MWRAIVAIVVLAAVRAYEAPCSVNEVPFGTGAPSNSSFTCEALPAVYSAALTFLESNLSPSDRLNKATLGFGFDHNGVAVHGANLSVHAKGESRFSALVPRRLFFEYVLPHAVTNEGRSHWRPLFASVVRRLLEAASPSWRDFRTTEAINVINHGLWDGALGGAITFQSQQTPLIYDVMSTIVFGHASCTGVSIVLVSALRSAGIASRLVGTPAWNGSHGNHNWVEVWSPDDGWQFLEASPAGSGSLANPCDKWFCTKSYMTPATRVLAAKFSQRTLERFVMAWDPDNVAIPGVDRSAYYHRVCSVCPA
ncbi:hypothetical protein SPRG_11583 [Saprolegnia parasitica CBS 223.65]|uniref:Transglutaminase-like domain-containing protein n=1 Tax=Saprolegnia parasitica (strain CBS 223.65) TaxID=695850 RepID=A0A067BWD1_SAPPC|nr:hypothetical protein SPRG_11583 [Saprolegnia parasitica CBS 223.65]KDO22824.1 hypothetical protein SPRG_11583 [Saprolegnia parasitica CBS 223.65]|eukprot:XP_012206495.1 hypothetical protein SPRG_11583 [Saprolegnia parasitica CBS 223.65]